jgi:hypothetical protein
LPLSRHITLLGFDVEVDDVLLVKVVQCGCDSGANFG